MEKNISFAAKKIGGWVSAVLLGDTRELVARIDERTSYMLEDIKDIKPKVSDMFPKVDILWKDKLAPASSPRQLNERGMHILNTSGIKEIIDEKKTELLIVIRQKNPTNAYDAEVTITSVVRGIPETYPETVEKLKQGAFLSGIDIDTMLFVGSIYLRNAIFGDLGFSLTDLDISQEK